MWTWVCAIGRDTLLSRLIALSAVLTVISYNSFPLRHHLVIDTRLSRRAHKQTWTRARAPLSQHTAPPGEGARTHTSTVVERANDAVSGCVGGCALQISE